MKQLTRQEVEGLIERLADKTLSRECLIRDKEGFPHVILMKNSAGNYLCEVMNNVQHTIKKSQIKEVLGHPIYLHNILDKAEVVLCWEEEERKDKIYEIWCLWYECGLSRSLQEIVDASGWKYTLTAEEEDSSIRKQQVLTSPEANALFSFLQEIL